MELEAGADYLVMAFCDDACSDLDLVLLDPDGIGIESDIFPDDEPALSFTAPATGTFLVRVAMVSCTDDPCRFGLGMFRGTIQEGLGLEGLHLVERLARFRQEFLSQGYSELPMEETGSLHQERELRYPLLVDEGVEYQLVGVCDDQCTDLNLVLYGPMGDVIASDMFDDAMPVLRVTSEISGVLLVGVAMDGCPVGPCEFRVAVFGKGDRVGPGGVMLPGRIVSAATLEGSLEEGDAALQGGEYSDAYSVEAEAGQLIVVDLRSRRFTTFLILESPGGQQEQGPHLPDDSGHSHLSAVAQEAGTYTVVVTSRVPGATGGYILQIAVAEGGRDPPPP
jgi:hypothetical protein